MSVTFLTDEDKNKLEQDISKISGDLTELETDLTELETSVSNLSQNKADKTDLTELESDVSNLSQNKADKTDLTSPFNFKGSTTYSALPTSGNTINDTYYCTDLKRRYTWNGEAWYPSSLDESEYTDELNQLSEEIEGIYENLINQFITYDALIFTKGAIFTDVGLYDTDDLGIYENNSRVNSKSIENIYDYVYVVAKENTEVSIRYYNFLKNDDGKKVELCKSSSTWEKSVIIKREECDFFKIVGRYADGSDIYDVTYFDKNIQVYLYDIDNMINKSFDYKWKTGTYSSYDGSYFANYHNRLCTADKYSIDFPFLYFKKNYDFIGVGLRVYDNLDNMVYSSEDFDSDYFDLTKFQDGGYKYALVLSPGVYENYIYGVAIKHWIFAYSVYEDIGSKNYTDNAISELKEARNTNFTIRAMKVCNYMDGTEPKIMWYLLEDVASGKFYKSTNLYNKIYLFKFSAKHPHGCYSFGITNDDDIIAVYRTEENGDYSLHSDDIKENPYVFLASEDWKVMHEVDFGTELKPSGWLENVGFCNLPDGTSIMCEYTRPSVNTANVWKISGNLLEPTNWVITKSFMLSGEINSGFKHCHSVQYDFFTKITYLTTGDDDVGAMVFYSTDYGTNWVLAREASEKYCRLLNFAFTKDWIYWTTDSSVNDLHFIFRCGRNSNTGVIDYSTIEELANLVDVTGKGLASYGTIYMKKLNILFIPERTDSKSKEMPIRIFDLNDMSVKTIGILKCTNTTDGAMMGFRCECVDWYPKTDRLTFSFMSPLNLGGYCNFIALFDNVGDNKSSKNNVNILFFDLFRDSNGNIDYIPDRYEG